MYIRFASYSSLHQKKQSVLVSSFIILSKVDCSYSFHGSYALQGNGTAKIFENDDRVITFSMHGEKNYPWRTKMKSNYDVDLPDDTGDEEYLTILNEQLAMLFDRHKPFLIFFQVTTFMTEYNSQLMFRLFKVFQLDITYPDPALIISLLWFLDPEVVLMTVISIDP